MINNFLVFVSVSSIRKALSGDHLTFDLPISQQVRAGGHSLINRTHNFEVSTVPLIGVVATVVLFVAGQYLLDAAPCEGRSDERRRPAKDEEWVRGPRPDDPPLSHWKSSLQLTGASLHSVDG